MDFSTLLDGLEGEDRAARERLLERLADEGYTLEEMEAAVEEDRLALLLVERVLGGRYTAKELAKESGLPAAQMLRIRRLLGLPEPGPDEPVFGDEEVDAAKAISMFLDVGSRARSRSPRSPASWAKGCRGWPPPRRPRSWTPSSSPGTARTR